MGSIQEIQHKLIYKIYEKDIFRYSYSILKNREDAEDALQETFKKFIESNSSYRRDCSVKTWLMTITRNYCYDFIRRRNNRNEIDNYPEPVIKTDNIELKMLLQSALETLKPEERELVFLRDVMGYNYQEISEILKITVENVKVKLHRTRKRLREIINGD